jgi:polyhydroxybutyrate depolymerase
MQVSRWDELAEEYGFLVVFPAGRSFPLRWSTQGQAGAEEEPLQDLQFISDLIDHLAKEYSIDPQRIYANGLSNGGGMSFLLSCSLSQRIAAIGTVSGAYLLSWDDCRPERPVPFIAFHGTEDQIVPFAGGPSRSFDVEFPAVEDWVATLAKRNGCTTLIELPQQGEVSGVRYTGCEADADVVFYQVAGGGHSWPGSDRLPRWIVGHTTVDVDASRLMWKFFEEHPLENQDP